MDTNVIGPAVVTAAFRPLLLRAQKSYSIYTSSDVGSLTKAAEPTLPTYRRLLNEEVYRISKIVLNMITVQEAIEFGSKGLKVFVMYPGFVVSNLRGTSDKSRSEGGNAGDLQVSGKTVLIIN